MARSGQFSGPTEQFLIPTGVVKTPNNAAAGYEEFSAELKDIAADLDDQAKYELQKQIEDVYALIYQIQQQANNRDFKRFG
jgi:hypothetical protein